MKDYGKIKAQGLGAKLGYFDLNSGLHLQIVQSVNQATQKF